MANNKYIFKFNQDDELYNYVELNSDKVISYFKVEENKLIRFDKRNHTKHFIKFKNDVKLKQKFISGESFITVLDKTSNEVVQYNMPEKEREIILIKNNVSISDFGKFVIKKWNELKGDENKINKKTDTELNFNGKNITSLMDSFRKNGIFY